MTDEQHCATTASSPRYVLLRPLLRTGTRSPNEPVRRFFHHPSSRHYRRRTWIQKCCRDVSLFYRCFETKASARTRILRYATYLNFLVEPGTRVVTRTDCDTCRYQVMRSILITYLVGFPVRNILRANFNESLQ
jgi:hypothetical protein